MHVENYPELLNIVKSIKSNLLLNIDRPCLLNRSFEPDPLKISLSFNPVISERTIENFIREDVCTLCDRRVGYKPGQFLDKKPRIPFLILIHNSFKLSQNNYFEDPEEEKIFRNMIKGGLEFDASDFLVREILRCYFGQKDEKNPQFTKNCFAHLKRDIETFNIKGILVLGQAASLLFNYNNEEIKNKTGQIITINGIPALISPGPNRINYMNKNKFKPDVIKNEKLTILNYLKKFKTEVMNT